MKVDEVVSDNELKIEPKTKWTISDGVLVLLVPILGYLITYSYELGYARYFSIPTYFISVNIINGLSLINAILGYFYIIAPLSFIFYEFKRNKKFLIAEVCLFAIIILFPLASLQKISDSSSWWEYSRTIYYTTGIIAFFIFIFPVITQRRVKGYVNKLIAQRVFETNRKDLRNILINHIGRSWSLIATFTLLLFIISGYLGVIDAASGKEFSIFSSSSGDYIVLRRYNEDFICAKYNKADNSISKDFILIKADRENTIYSYIKIQNLKR